MIGLDRRRFSGLVVVLLLFAATGLAAESPFDVGDRAQLFVDRILVHKVDRVFFTQHSGRPHPENPLILADRPWEGWRLEMHGTVIYDQEEGIFKMWYLGDAGDSRDYFDSRYFICYATSPDGIRWEKPLVGTLPSNNGQPHNAVLTGTTLGNVVKDSRDPDPNRRYKMMGSHGKTYVSPDGLQWRPYSQGSVWPDFSDATTGFWDERRSLFVMFPKVGNRARTYWLGHKRRLFYTITSRDFVAWTEPVLTWTTDARDDAGSLARLEHVRSVLDRPDDPQLMRTEYYGIGVYTAESCTIGFPWIFTINNNARWGNHEGPQEVQLAVSRDLFHWERPFRTPVIPMGDMGEWDCCYQATGNRALRVGDEIRVYYDGANYTHGTPALYRAAFEDGRPTGRGRITASIGLATWPLDRFVSVDAGAREGVLTTVPVTFSGSRLVLNAQTRPQGWITAEILDVAGRPIEELRPSTRFTGDSLRQELSFPGSPDLSRWAGQPVVLRFRLQEASLFSFAFRR